jgi:hypothetical protein
MTENTPAFTAMRKCEHCENKAPMLIATIYSQVDAHEEDVGQFGHHWEEGYVHELLECPACKGVILRRYYYHDQMDWEAEEHQTLYPVAQGLMDGLPQSVERAYESARRVRNVDPNAFGVLLGRVLDGVCKDRGAEGDSLYKRLEFLATRGDIPSNLVVVAHSLRQLRNVGAHGDLGELTPKEIPLLEDLTRAILEYVYRAPLLATRAAERVQRLRPIKEEADDIADTA